MGIGDWKIPNPESFLLFSILPLPSLPNFFSFLRQEHGGVSGNPPGKPTVMNPAFTANALKLKTFAEPPFFSRRSKVAWYLLVKRYFQDIAHAMPIRGVVTRP
jgi:hypothetical protein